MSADRAITVFGPHPLLSVTVERVPGELSDAVHLHAAGQGVWVARAIVELGGRVAMCGFVGGEVGAVLRPLLSAVPGPHRWVDTDAESGAYVTDRRTEVRNVIAFSHGRPATRHETDDLISATCASAAASDVLVVCNPFPAEALPTDAYTSLISAARVLGVKVFVDLSGERLRAALVGRPDLVKLNDWELAEYVHGPVGTISEARAAVDRLFEEGAGAVIVTRGADPAYAITSSGDWLVIDAPRFEHGAREGCGDTMMGAIAVATARGDAFADVVRFGAAAGAANFLRRGLGTVCRSTVDELVGSVRVRSLAPLS